MRPNIEHFTHSCHQLAEVYGSEEFKCDGCKTPGNGPRYRCHTCDFNMHDYCGVCPSTLSTFMHPQHLLQRMVQAQDRPDNRRVCDLCEGNVEGLFYRCTICDFNIHPLCTQLPEHVHHALDPSHELRLRNSSPAWCVVCGSVCASWRYGCGTCGVDIHLECILERCDTSKALPRSAPRPESPHGVAPSPLPWAVYGGPTPHGAYSAPYGSYWQQPPAYGPYGPGPSHPYCSPYGSYWQHPPPYGLYGPSPPYYHPSPTPFVAYAHAYAYTPPLPCSFVVAPPSSHDVHAHSTNQQVNEAQGSGNAGKPSKGKKLAKIMYAIVGNLTIGVLTSVIFGL